MADNVAITAGVGTTIAADDIGGVLHQRVKLSQGADGVAVDVSAAAPLQVSLANTGANATAVKVDGSAVTQPVSGTVTSNLAAGTNNIGDVDILTINGVAPAYGAGVAGVTVPRVTIASDDLVNVTGTVVAQDGGGSITVDGTFWQATQPVSIASPVPVTDNAGSLTVDAPVATPVYVRLSDGAAAITTLPVSLSSVPSHAVTNAGTFAVQSTNQANSGVDIGDVTINNATGASAVNIQDGGNSITVDGTFWQATQPVSGTVTANAGTGTMAVSMATNTPLGTVAHDSADSGAPIKTGGRASSAEITPVTTGDRTDSIHDLAGKQVVMPYANNENFVSGAITTAMTGTTSTSLVAAPAAGLRNYITTIIVSNAHGTVGTDVVIQDGSGGTTLMTIPAAAVYGGAVITLPIPLRQPTTATAIYCANVTTGASTKVSAVGYKGY